MLRYLLDRTALYSNCGRNYDRNYDRNYSGRGSHSLLSMSEPAKETTSAHGLRKGMWD